MIPDIIGKRIHTLFIPHGLISLTQSALSLMLLTVACAVAPTFKGVDARLFTPSTHSVGNLDEAMKSRVIRYRFVNVDSRLLAPIREASKNLKAIRRVLILNLFDDAVYPVVLTQQEVRSSNSSTWSGQIEGIENSQVTLVNESGVVVGNIRLQGRLYEVRYAGEGMHVIYQIDPNAFPKESEPIIIPGTRK